MVDLARRRAAYSRQLLFRNVAYRVLTPAPEGRVDRTSKLGKVTAFVGRQLRLALLGVAFKKR